MSARPPFVDPATGELDPEQIFAETIAVVKLAVPFVALSFVPLAPLVTDAGAAGPLLVLLAQFVLAVGAAIVLIYAVARGIQLSGAC